MTQVNTSLVIKVTRESPELVPPAWATPYEYKELSDNDNQANLHSHTTIILFYENDEHTGGVTLRGKDPAKMVKEAVGKALVWYYPLAGRLREKGGRMVVECNGEGVVFIEANANVILEDFGHPNCPPFAFLDQLLCDVPGSNGILDCPLLLIQVTKLKCGGFILALRLNRVMADATGLVQFMNAVAMVARGAEYPPIEAIWERHLLTKQVLPEIIISGVYHDDVKGSDVPLDDLVSKSFFFGPNEMAVIRSCLPPCLKSSSSTFEVLTAYLWRTRTITLSLDPNELVHISLSIDARSVINPPLPAGGYYGNVVAYATAQTTVCSLLDSSLEYALKLIKKAKANIMVSETYMKFIRPTRLSTFEVVDVSRVGFDKLDFGWGLPFYGGYVENRFDDVFGFRSCYLGAKNCFRENGIMVPICLPRLAMDRFAKELNGLFGNVSGRPVGDSKSFQVISSSL